jgi:hypothetical protein
MSSIASKSCSTKPLLFEKALNLFSYSQIGNTTQKVNIAIALIKFMELWHFPSQRSSEVAIDFSAHAISAVALNTYAPKWFKKLAIAINIARIESITYLERSHPSPMPMLERHLNDQFIHLANIATLCIDLNRDTNSGVQPQHD